MKRQEKIKFLLDNGKNYPLSYWKGILFKEKEEFWQEFEQKLRIERKVNKSDSFRLTLKMLKGWKKEWVVEKNSEKEKEVIEEDDNQNEVINEKEDTKIRKVKCKGELNLVGYKLPCYVLEDGVRGLSIRGIQKILGIVDKDDRQKYSANRLGKFLSQKSLQPFIYKEKGEGNFDPIICYDKNDVKMHIHEATKLIDIADGILEARKSGKLGKRKSIVAERSEILVRAFAKTGVVALIDEATGYQHERKNKNTSSQKTDQDYHPHLDLKSWGPFTYFIKNNTLTYQNRPLALVYHSDIGGYWFSLKQDTTPNTIRLWLRLEDNYQITTHLKIFEEETETNYQAFFSYLRTDYVALFFQPSDEVFKNEEGKWRKRKIESNRLVGLIQEIRNLPVAEQQIIQQNLTNPNKKLSLK